jgi:transposase
MCYDLKERFRAIFNDTDNRNEAQKKLCTWILDVVKSDLEEYYSFVKMLLNWKENIVNYFIKRLSSSFVEGVNNKIKLIKRKAFGFVNFENFKTKIKDCFS